MISAQDAMRRLQEGNARFVSDNLDPGSGHHQVRRDQLLAGQEPFAIVVGCSDSRVPVEIVFDQGLGDLFVVRVAGNVVSKTQLGSIEFAATQFGARLVVVLGHSGCGAIQAALAAVEAGIEPGSDNLRLLIDEIRPAVRFALDGDGDHDTDALVDRAGRENVRRAADVIRSRSGIIRQLVEDDGLVVVGAQYSLATGAVDFF